MSTPSGNFDDEIANHASAPGHWPGKTLDEIKAIIEDVRMQFFDREASILLGATLMHWGVPFRAASKREFTGHQQAIIDQASDKLIAVRDAHLQARPEEIGLSDSEIALLAEVLDDCVKECGNDPVELRLQLHTGERREAEMLMERLRSLLQESRHA